MNERQHCRILSCFIQLFFLLAPCVTRVLYASPFVLRQNVAENETTLALNPHTQLAQLPRISPVSSGSGTSLSVPNGRAQSTTEAAVRAEIEKGTPASLRSAVSRLRQQGTTINDQEKIWLYIATSIYTMVYPTERVNWDVPAFSGTSVYLNIIETAKMGTYDFTASTGTDFLSLVLPSLVLFTAPNLKNYYTEAETALTAAVTQKPQSVLANFLLGTLYARQEKYDKAVKAFEVAFTVQSDSVTLSAPYIETLLHLNRAKEAYNAAVKVLLKNSTNLQVLILCAESAYAMGDWALADQYVSQVLQNDSNNARFLLLRSRIFLESGDFARAASALDAYTRSEKPNRDYYYIRSRLQYEWNKNLPQAASTLSEGLGVYPHDRDLLLLAAAVASDSGLKINGMSASQLATRILSTDANNAHALTIMIKEAIKNEQWQTVYDRTSRLMNIQNDDTAKMLRIEGCLGLKKHTEALELSRELFKQNGTNEDILLLYIRVLISTKNTAEAKTLIEKSLPQSQQKAKSALYYQRSRLASDSAVKLNDLRNSLTANPRNNDALFDLYGYYYARKDYRKAQYYLKQVIALRPSDQKLLKLQTELESLLSQ